MGKLLYNISDTEAEVLYYLCDKEARVKEISDDLNRSRSTVQRYLSKLRSTGLVERRSVVEEGKKGRYYIYSSSTEELKDELKEKLSEWYEDKMEMIDEI